MIINLESGSYFSVTGAGAAIWPQLIAGADLQALATHIESAFAVDAAVSGAELGAFVDRLLSEGILRSSEAESAAAGTSA
ncbi:MAG: PqqD family protein, partial [Xanthobacteraceae bacterium]